MTEVLSCPVIGVEPLVATDPVSAVAMSEKSLLTADEEIIVFGVKGACGKEYTPDEFLGIKGSCFMIQKTQKLYRFSYLNNKFPTWSEIVKATYNAQRART